MGEHRDCGFAKQLEVVRSLVLPPTWISDFYLYIPIAGIGWTRQFKEYGQKCNWALSLREKQAKQFLKH